jgi:formylmethanofuran dehydrogenase subunit E-like metal-binding protein
MSKIKHTLVFFLAFSFILIPAAWATDNPSWLDSGRAALNGAMTEMGVSKADPNLLVLTNAGYGVVGNQSTEAFLDTAVEETGCTMGTRTLLPVHTGVQEQLWCSLYQKDTGKLVFLKWTGKGFERQIMDASPAHILTPAGWKDASSGLIGQRLFSVASLCLTWAVEPPWTLLLAATFHDHFCPGVNSGYIAGQYLMEKLPFGTGDKYVFVACPGKCYADALQVMFNATAGKSSCFAMAINGKTIAKYTKEGVQPSIVAMRVNGKADTCDGLVLGFDWNKAYEDTGVRADEMAPKGGPNNPMFWVARARMSRELARLPKEKLLAYIFQFKSFSGKANLAEEVAGGNPYAVVWNN